MNKTPKNGEDRCPQCGFEYGEEMAMDMAGRCPKCMANFIKGDGDFADGTDAQMNDPSLMKPGTTFNDLEIIELIGSGGMGHVYKARQVKLDRIVALKVLSAELASSDEFVARFEREAKALAALNHPNIVQVHDHGQEDDKCYLVMEYVDGADLRHILDTNPIHPATALRYVPQICDALEYAHSLGIIHRDIKPENILINKQGGLKVTDFGIAKMTLGGEAVHSHMTKTGSIMGTPHYMAPEQMRETSSVDHRADIYSLGVVFYEMLTGELPIGRFAVPSSSVNVHVGIDEVVLKSLEQRPELRYQSVTEVKTGVRNSSVSTSVSVPPPIPGKQPFKICNLALIGLLLVPLSLSAIYGLADEIKLEFISNDIIRKESPSIQDSDVYKYFLYPAGLISIFMTPLLGFFSSKQIASSNGSLQGLTIAKLLTVTYPAIFLVLWCNSILPVIVEAQGFEPQDHKFLILCIVGVAFLVIACLALKRKKITSKIRKIKPTFHQVMVKLGFMSGDSHSKQLRYLFINMGALIPLCIGAIAVSNELRDANQAARDLQIIVFSNFKENGKGHPLNLVRKLESNFFGKVHLARLANNKQGHLYRYKSNSGSATLFLEHIDDGVKGHIYRQILHVDFKGNEPGNSFSTSLHVPRELLVSGVEFSGSKLIIDYYAPPLHLFDVSASPGLEKESDYVKSIFKSWGLVCGAGYRLALEIADESEMDEWFGFFHNQFAEGVPLPVTFGKDPQSLRDFFSVIDFIFEGGELSHRISEGLTEFEHFRKMLLTCMSEENFERIMSMNHAPELVSNEGKVLPDDSIKSFFKNCEVIETRIDLDRLGDNSCARYGVKKVSDGQYTFNIPVDYNRDKGLILGQSDFIDGIVIRFAREALKQ